jgi:hypothetical protein
MASRSRCGGAYRGYDSLIAATAADISRHPVQDFLVARTWIGSDQGGGLHDLAGLAKPALWHIKITPGLLNGMVSIGAEALDRRYRLSLGL